MRIFKELKTVIYLFLWQTILAFIFEFIFKGLNFYGSINFLENLLFTIAIIAFSFLIKKNNLKRYFFAFCIVVYNTCLAFETIYYYYYDSFLNSSAIFIIFESNSSEIGEFFESRLDSNVFVFIFLIIVITIINLFRLNKIVFLNSWKSVKKVYSLASILLIYITLKSSKLIVYNLPYLLIKTPISYYQEMKKFEVYGKDNMYGNFTNVIHKQLTDKELYVILVGESTNRSHFQLCGNYYRETTPLLNDIKDELIIYNNVISPHTYTIGSLSKVLTLGNYENPDKTYKGSLIQLFNQAKFKTYWLSNQRPIGVMDTHVTKIGMGAHKSIFINDKHTSKKTPFDKELLTSFKKILKEAGNKKVIFLHMLGSHVDYNRRYPTEFDFFKDEPQTKFKKKKAFMTINAYDNAVRYNDFLIRDIIETVRKQQVNSYVFYFSDHGQEVFDDIDFFGHTIDQEITANMYDIPMFLWVSDSFKLRDSINLNKNKKYMTDDLIHSLSDISNINSDEIDVTRSIFNKDFKERKRVIKDTIDYDVFFD